MTVLAAFFVVVLFYLFKQRKQLKAVRRQLEYANEHLLQTNDKLQWMNEWTKKSNAKWQAENRKLKEQLDAHDH